MKVLGLTTLTLLLTLSALSSSAAQDDSWNNMMDGIKKYSAGEKAKEEFHQLCQESDTAEIDARVDTGGGLYMLMDVVVYLEPDKTKIAQLEDKTTVVLMGDEIQSDGKEWIKIKFLNISSYSQQPIGIGEGWVEKGSISR